MSLPSRRARDLDRLGSLGRFLQAAQRAVDHARRTLGLRFLFLLPVLLLGAHQQPGEQARADALDEVALAPGPLAMPTSSFTRRASRQPRTSSSNGRSSRPSERAMLLAVPAGRTRPGRRGRPCGGSRAPTVPSPPATTTRSGALVEHALPALRPSTTGSAACGPRGAAASSSVVGVVVPARPAPGLWISVTRTQIARMIGHMRILITNDDGVYSPGIAALAQVASRFGEVRIVAPDVEMSSASHSITASRPVTYKRTPLPGRHRGLPRQRHAGRLRDARHHAVGEGRSRALRHQHRHQPRQRHLALRHAGRGEAGGAARPARHRVQRAGHRPRAAELRAAQALGRPRCWRRCSKCPTCRSSTSTSRRSRRAARVWTRQSMRHYDGKVVPAQGPDGSHALLVHRRAGRSDRGRHRPLGDRAGYVSMTPLRLDLTDDEQARAKRARSKPGRS